MSISIGTLGDCLDHAHSIYIHCGCGKQGWLDLEKAIAKVGRDQSMLAADLLPKIRCEGCGEKGRQGMTLHGPHPGMIPASRAKARG